VDTSPVADDRGDRLPGPLSLLPGKVKELASRYNMEFILQPGPPDFRARTFPDNGRTYVVLNSLLPAYRLLFAACHEVAETELRRAGATMDREEMHRAADQLAADWLAMELDEHIGLLGLKALKERFPLLSHEFIARRIAGKMGRPDAPIILTVIDNGRTIYRVSSPGRPITPEFLPVEKEALKRCRSGDGSSMVAEPGARCEAVSIDEGRGVVRIILLTWIEDPGG